MDVKITEEEFKEFRGNKRTTTELVKYLANFDYKPNVGYFLVLSPNRKSCGLYKADDSVQGYKKVLDDGGQLWIYIGMTNSGGKF